MKVLITGAAGVIGSVLRKGLTGKYEIIGVDKISKDDVIPLDLIKNQNKVFDLLKNIDVVIHLAWDTREAGGNFDVVIPENKLMGEIMYSFSLKQKVKKFILASSVHVVFGHINYQPGKIVEEHQILHAKRIKITDEYFPLSAYGASKVYLEMLGKAYSQKGLQVIAVRFGNVTPDNSFGEYPFWLSHRDCSQFIEKCIQAKNLPNFSVFFAISNNPCNPFDLTPAKILLGYEPQDSSKCPLTNFL